MSDDNYYQEMLDKHHAHLAQLDALLAQPADALAHHTDRLDRLDRNYDKLLDRIGNCIFCD